MKKFGSFQVLYVFLGFLIMIPAYDAVLTVEVHALNSFKQSIFEDPFLVLSNWNSFDSDPCNWFGVTCTGNQVTKLNISGSSIKGFIAEELFQLSSLQELILHGNKLLGPIPRSIGSLKFLKVLDLGNNSLTGPIPSEIGKLVSIETINLGSNGLEGRLPFELSNLQRLQDLRLDRNKLLGLIPGANANASSVIKQGFCRLPTLKFGDFSYNFLVGIIPKCLSYLPRTSFRGNCLPYKDIKQRTSEQCGVVAPVNAHRTGAATLLPAGNKSKNRAHNSKPVWVPVVEVMTGLMVVALVVIGTLMIMLRCKTKPSVLNLFNSSKSYKNHMAVHIDSNMLKGVTRYTRQELEVACEDFSNIIGSSSDSLVYKGNLKGGPEIAVISLCIKEEHWTGYLELYYQKEVADLARLNHVNTGRLLGYCIDNTPFTRMLVFEYTSNGTLYEHLHYEEGCNLSWSRRMKIIIGIAKGLKYLHTEIEPPFTISELNSSAVYLTDDFSPKLVDFESWKTIVSRSENNSRSISHEGAICVLPNSWEERHLDIQGNIYSFGVLLLEIVSGRPSFCKDKGCLVDWAKDYVVKQEEMVSIVDPALKYFNGEDLKVICDVVSMCIHLRPRDQVSMKDMCAMLETKINATSSAEMKASSLAWAELMLSP
ncbi:probable LRR receptor-like serine/threonine-protein kinase At1g63430 [Rutidosis leptorrhynchoides]|uniref:probable LRR receptor-like serine/threonine-protein kinase At1g63430 n=1 Tax=Rutidosis leptorrhynchoides TaxID=125765 RepID=UPI003A99075B